MGAGQVSPRLASTATDRTGAQRHTDNGEHSHVGEFSQRRREFQLFVTSARPGSGALNA